MQMGGLNASQYDYILKLTVYIELRRKKALR